jgi:Tol biopolymer transport system component
MNKTGDPVLLGPPANRLRNPSWSPDGQWLYVEADWRSFSDIYRLPRIGGEPARLTAAPHGSFEPAVSPDGKTVAFGSSRDGNAEIYIMGVTGGNPTRLSHDTGDDIHPRWQSEKHLAWLRRREGSTHFWLTDLDHPEQAYALAQSPETEALDLVFSADGHWAAITVRYPPNGQGIEVIDVQQNAIVARLDGEGPDEGPCFSPDSQWLLFSSARSGDVELWRVRPDGSELEQWTHRTGADWLPRWFAAW